MIYQVLLLNKSSREVARNLNVDHSTVSRTVKLFNEQGDVTKRDYPDNEGTAKLTEIDKLIILEISLVYICTSYNNSFFKKLVLMYTLVQSVNSYINVVSLDKRWF